MDFVTKCNFGQLLVFWLEGYEGGIFCVAHLIEGAVGSSSGLFLQEFASALAMSCWSSLRGEESRLLLLYCWFYFCVWFCFSFLD